MFVAFSTGDGLLLVDGGAPNYGEKVVAALKGVAANSKVQALFNTHYHLDQTGNNELFAASGAKIIAHDRTRQWMSTDYWLPDKDRYEKARPKAAWPTQTFFNTESMKTGGEQVDCGYLVGAHGRRHLRLFQGFQCSRRWRCCVAGERPGVGLD